MIVTLIEKQGKYKYKVFLDYDYVFWLTWKELYFWNIKENEEISDEYYIKIIKESIIPKAKRKAISYLEKSSRTEQEIRDKLRRELYQEDIIENVIKYLYSYHYLNDDWVAENFVRSNQFRHSRKWLEMKLSQKGIDKDRLHIFFEEEYSEKFAIQKEIEKKLKGRKQINWDEKNKIMAYLYRKGYNIHESRKVIEQIEIEHNNSNLRCYKK